jgi:hypothetical protein
LSHAIETTDAPLAAAVLPNHSTLW